MKKSKLSLSVVTGLLGVIALSACSNVNAKENAIVSFKGYDGNSNYSIITDSMYQEYRDSVTGISKFYERILEVLIRHAFNEKQVETDKTLGTIEREASDDVEDKKSEARANKKSNGTSYNTEWKKILDSNGVENEEELKQLFIYNKEKQEIEDWYYKENLDTLKKEYIGVDKDGNKVNPSSSYNGMISSRYPYHIRHILVKTDSDAKNYSTGTITEEQAKSLYNVVSKIRDGKLTFGEIALSNSEDSSNEKYGDVGIMTNKASSTGSLQMASEFQLGLYAYDSLTHASNQAIENGLGISGTFEELSGLTEKTVKEAYSEYAGISQVPYSVFEKLNDLNDASKVGGMLVYENASVVYPRNVLWNKYLNRHNAFLITNNERSYSAVANRADDPDKVSNTYDSTLLLANQNAKQCGFRQVKNIKSLANSALDKNLGVLTDEEGRPIIGVRSEYGIHFMIIQKSVYDFANNDLSLEEYYTTYVPGDAKYPKTASGEDKNTYVNFLNTNKSGYNTRASEVKEAIKSFDSTYDYRLYEKLIELNGDKLKFANDLDKKINDYLNKQRENNAVNQEEGLNLAWSSYLELLEAQNQARHNKERMVPEGCIIAFEQNSLDGVENLYKKGGACYYGNK